MTQGLINANLLDGKGGAKTLDWEEVVEWKPGAGLLWVHLDYTDPTVRDWLITKIGLDEMVSDALVAEDTRPRVTRIGDGLLISLRGINKNPGAEPEDMVAIRLWVEKDRIISTRRRFVFSVRELIATLREGQGPNDPCQFIYDLSDRLTSRMGDVIEEVEANMAELEEAVLDANSHVLRSELSALRRRVIGLRKYLAPQREALLRLQSEQVSWIDDKDRMHLREVGEHLIRHLDDLEAVRDRAIVTQEELVNLLSDQMNQRMYVLSIIAAIFLPLGFFTGLLGINVGGIPGAENSWAFAIFIGLLVLLVALEIWIFRKMKWL